MATVPTPLFIAMPVCSNSVFARSSADEQREGYRHLSYIITFFVACQGASTEIRTLVSALRGQYPIH